METQTRTFTIKNGQTLTIRDAQPSDAAAKLAHVEQVAGESDFLEYGEGELQSTLERQFEVIGNFLAAHNQVMLVAMIDDELAGMINFSGGKRPRNEHVGEFGITVLKKYWGLGIGRYLLQALIDWAQESGTIRKINLRVRTDNEAGVALYEKLGFKREGLLTRELLIDGQFYDMYLMGLNIG